MLPMHQSVKKHIPTGILRLIHSYKERIMFGRRKSLALETAQAVLLSTGLGFGAQVLAGALHADLAASTLAYLPQEPMLVHVTLGNEGKLPVRMLTWGTPLEGMLSNALKVTHDGQEIAYLGPVVSRRQPLPQDYLILAPGERRTVVVDLAKAYAVDKPGRYEVSWRLQEIDGAQAGAKGTGSLPITGTSASFELLGAREHPMTKANPMAAQASCTASQLSLLNQARQAASRSASSAYQALSGTPEASRVSAARYATWFGAYTASRWQAITSNFSKIAAATSRLTYNCTCEGMEDNVIAYVYPSRPYEVTLCAAFWDEPVSGSDYSMASTLVHETSHFNAVAGTDDIAYGPAACKRLAQSNPAKAANNADNYGFFSVNSAGSSMSKGDSL